MLSLRSGLVLPIALVTSMTASGCSGGGGTGSLPSFEANVPHSSDSAIALPGGALQTQSGQSVSSFASMRSSNVTNGTQSSQTVPASALYDAVGVNTHLSRGNHRANYPGVIALLANLGAKHIREGINGNPDARAMALQKTIFQQYGIDSTETISPNQPVTTWVAYKNGIGAGMVGFEGVNEPDNRQSNTNWIAPTLAAQKQAWSAVHGGSPVLAGMQVEGPSILGCSSAAAYGNQSSSADFANMHRYFSGHEPTTTGWGGSKCGTSATYGSLAYNVAIVQQAATNRPIRTTETGYCTAPVRGCVPADVAAQYEPQIFTQNFLYNASAGSTIPRTYIYELISEDNLSTDSSLGLADAGFNPKPMYYAVQGYISHLKDAPGASSATLSYTIGGAAKGLTTIPLRYSNGDYGMVLYNSSSVWNPNGSATSQGSPISVPVDNIVFSIPGQTMNHLVSSTYDGTGRWTDSAPTSAQQTSVAVTAYMHILRWSAGTAPSPTPAPTATPTATPTSSPIPTPSPTAVPTPTPTAVPTPMPTPIPTPSPTATPDDGMAIHAGGATSGAWVADKYFSGGHVSGTYNGAIDTSSTTNPAPQAIYQSARFGDSFSYSLPGLGAGSSRTVRLHFNENYANAVGRRVFSVAMSGTAQTLDRLDILQQAGARHKAIAVTFNNVVADSRGTIVITFTHNVGHASVNGIEVF